MRVVRFRSRALPDGVGDEVRRRLHREHALRPFSAIDARETVRRVAHVAESMGLHTTIYRGAVGLRGAEVDHVWLEVEGRVLDASFPLLEQEFVELLRRFVAGDLTPEDLALAAHGITLDSRVFGEFPDSILYLGEPVWTRRALPGPASPA